MLIYVLHNVFILCLVFKVDLKRCNMMYNARTRPFCCSLNHSWLSDGVYVNCLFSSIFEYFQQMSLTRQSSRIRWQQVTPLEQVHSQLVLVSFCNTTTNTHLYQARTNTFWAFIVICSTSVSLVSFLDEHPIIQDTDLTEKHTSSTKRIHSSH